MLGILKDISKQKDIELKLRRRADDLERLNQVMIGRELKMIELKKKINEMENRDKDVPVNGNSIAG